MKEVDQVFIHSPGLLAKKGAINPRTSFVPNGCAYQAYSRPALEPPDLAGIPHWRIGYTGRIKRQLDWELLLELTSRHPEWSFVFVGPVTDDPEVVAVVHKMSQRPNIHFLGFKTVEQLASYPQHFDVCMMPYRMTDYTKYIYPLKLHEYLASGKPTVGSPILSLKQFDHVVRLAQTVDEWSEAISGCLGPEERSVARMDERQKVARDHDWDRLVEVVARTLCDRLGYSLTEKTASVALHRKPEPRCRSEQNRKSLYERGRAIHPVALQRCDRFVARTTNWLYDHLRFVPKYEPLVVCDMLQNRTEFPELQVRCLDPQNVVRRVWKDLGQNRPLPYDLWRLKQLSPRILHSHFGYVARRDVELQRALGIPWVVSFYGADVYEADHSEQTRQIYSLVFQLAARILALGPAMAGSLELLGCPRDKIRIHPLGVDVENLPYRVRVLKRGEPLRVLFAGTFREKKGISYAIEAVSLAVRSGMAVQLYLVAGEMGKAGDSDIRHSAFEQIKTLRLQDAVIYKPLLPFRELVDLALNSHIFVAPSVTAADGDAEGTPFVLQQMMATGMPVIATIHKDIPFLFGEYQSQLVPERNAEAIAERLREYANKPDRLGHDGAALRERIRSIFDVSRCASRLSDLYDEAIGAWTGKSL